MLGVRREEDGAEEELWGEIYVPQRRDRPSYCHGGEGTALDAKVDICTKKEVSAPEDRRRLRSSVCLQYFSHSLMPLFQKFVRKSMFLPSSTWSISTLFTASL